MHRITADEILELHDAIVSTSGGAHGVLNWAALEAAVEQPFLTFGGDDLYPTLVDKAATLGFLIIRNHVFVDGNKRTGHAAMRVLLLLDGYAIDAGVDEQEQVILRVAAGQLSREEFAEWLRGRVVKR